MESSLCALDGWRWAREQWSHWWCADGAKARLTLAISAWVEYVPIRCASRLTYRQPPHFYFCLRLPPCFRCFYGRPSFVLPPLSRLQVQTAAKWCSLCARLASVKVPSLSCCHWCTQFNRLKGSFSIGCRLRPNLREFRSIAGCQKANYLQASGYELGSLISLV